MSVDMSTTMPKYESYKDSGTDWIGYIPAHWELKRLKFIDTVKMGQSPDSNDCNDLEMGLPFLQGNAEFGLEHPTPRLWCIRPKKISSKGDLLFSVRAPVGAINRSDQKYCIGRGLAAITVNCSHKALRKFQLLASVESFKKLLTGSTFEAISTDDLKNLLLCIPNEGEIALITKFLDKKTTQIDEAIAIKEQQIALLKERKQIIIQKSVTQGLDPTVPMKDSGVDWIGKIPAHWEVKQLKHLLSEPLKYGANESGVDYQPELPRYIRITDFSGDGQLSDEKKLSLPWRVGREYLLGDSDILLARSGATVGKSYQFKKSMSNESSHCFAGYLIKATADNSKMISDYLYLYLGSDCFTAWKSLIFNKATIENIGADKYASLFVVVPPLSEQKEILGLVREKLNPISLSIDTFLDQIRKLKEYKTTLINSAVTGKIRITPDMVEA